MRFGGDAAISRSLARWILHHDDNAGLEVDGDTVVGRYYFDDELKESSTPKLRFKVHKIRYDEYVKLKAENDGIKDEKSISNICPKSDEIRVSLTDHKEVLLNS